ncbi:hypothetical protein VNO77_30614 [Canavalia gladiata]|uniref:Uncharacterized protein n=1 Tax=Canavalia gladiata TaxID=3824 RepID=A0AAN9KN68_CANGL
MRIGITCLVRGVFQKKKRIRGFEGFSQSFSLRYFLGASLALKKRKRFLRFQGSPHSKEDSFLEVDITLISQTRAVSLELSRSNHTLEPCCEMLVSRKAIDRYSQNHKKCWGRVTEFAYYYTYFQDHLVFNVMGDTNYAHIFFGRH